MKLRHTTISIPTGTAWLEGDLCHAPDVRGLAVLLRAAGGPRAKSVEVAVGETLQQAGFATLVINLLTAYEETRDPDARFNVPQMASRVLAVAEWVGHQPPLAGLAVGLVACGTASGAAVRAAWKSPEHFAAIVCGAGRPDLAGATPLNTLTTPVRFVVGGDDPHTPMLMNAYEHLGAPRDWQTLDGVGEHFVEPGAIGGLARLAADWLVLQLPPPQSAAPAPFTAPSSLAAAGSPTRNRHASDD
ncbi:dienelactone hydrolase family protein [Aromatoleum sp.]|uniref:dienelactone hydrolase family protein n=1 Tax=Aromatoleum sp. TaxID=2307007 RepID=UPI002FC5EB7E